MARMKSPSPTSGRPNSRSEFRSDSARGGVRQALCEEREGYLDRKAIPHIIGPDKQSFMVDHHHLVRVLWSLDIREAALGDELADWSDLEIKSFWRKIELNGYCWPIDADGNRRPYAAIPDRIGDLTDNVWRSLARRVRERRSRISTRRYRNLSGATIRTFMSLR